MITPSFQCTQNDQFVIIAISLPNVKMTDMEYIAVDNTFRFYVKPYFLRLTFDEEFVNDGTDYAQYDVDKSILYVCVPKRERGKEWKDLNMVTKLLSSEGTHRNPFIQNSGSDAFIKEKSTTRKSNGPFSFDMETIQSDLKPFPTDMEDEEFGTIKKQKQPLITVISEHNFEDDVNEMGEKFMKKIVNADQFDFAWEQTIPKPFEENHSGNIIKSRDSSLLGMENQMDDFEIKLQSCQYGFNQQYSNVFSNYTRDLILEIIDLPNPEDCEPEKRTQMRMELEKEEFDVEHYLADLVDDEMIQEILQFKPRFYIKKKKDIIWNEIEQTMLSNLPRKKYLIDNERAVYLSLVDILCSYCYNHRTFLGENNIESAWTITKMSCTLSWFEIFDSLHFCLKSFISRVLCYPLYRHFILAKQCVKDCAMLLCAGKQQVLRALLEIKYIMEHSPGSGHYLLAKLYLNDYCSWIQNENENRLTLLATEIEKTLDRITVKDFDQEFQLSLVERFVQENPDVKNEGYTQRDNSKPIMI
jgi:protein SHQ1